MAPRSCKACGNASVTGKDANTRRSLLQLASPAPHLSREASASSTCWPCRSRVKVLATPALVDLQAAQQDQRQGQQGQRQQEQRQQGAAG